MEPDQSPDAAPTLRPETYRVLNPLTPSEIEWLRQQSARVAEVFRETASPRI
jgi:hypothetical protein